MCRDPTQDVEEVGEDDHLALVSLSLLHDLEEAPHLLRFSTAHHGGLPHGHEVARHDGGSIGRDVGCGQWEPLLDLDPFWKFRQHGFQVAAKVRPVSYT